MAAYDWPIPCSRVARICDAMVGTVFVSVVRAVALGNKEVMLFILALLRNTTVIAAEVSYCSNGDEHQHCLLTDVVTATMD